MVVVNNLTKVYKSKKKDKCIALDKVSFALADTGFVFVIGKSGSGKKTLLSLIGGLDNITSGDIKCILSVIFASSFNAFKNTALEAHNKEVSLPVTIEPLCNFKAHAGHPVIADFNKAELTT